MKFELKRPYQHFTDAELLEDLRRVSQIIRSPTVTGRDYTKHGRFNMRTVSDRFGSWSQALREAGLSSVRPVAPEDLVADLKRVASIVGRDFVSIEEYRRHGKWSEAPFRRVFGNWSNAVAAAGLCRNPYAPGVSEIDLFEDLERIWIRLGRQPRYHEMKSLSCFSPNTYCNRYGSWRKALEAFVNWMEDEPEGKLVVSEQNFSLALPEKKKRATSTKNRRQKRTPRFPNLRLRFRVMRRDNFTCRACGRSPATDPSVELHVDHVKAWSNGGETVLENLQTLCSKCNIGKSNVR